MNLLEVNNICKTYGSGETAVHALKKVSFSVPKGEYVAIVGESGSGKRTLLNMIGALDTYIWKGNDWRQGYFFHERPQTYRFPPEEYRIYFSGVQSCAGAYR